MENREESKSTEKANPVKSERQWPLYIGYFIRELMKEQHITPKELAQKLQINKRSIYPLLKRRHLSVKMMIKASEALDVNLFRQYQPRVTIVPSSLEDENRQLKEQILQLNARLEEMKNLKEENIRLKSKVELLQELFKAK